MNARTLTTGFALTATLLFASSAMADATYDTGVGNEDDIRPSFKSESATYNPTSPRGPHLNTDLLGSRLVYDPSRGGDLASQDDASIVRVMAIRYLPTQFKWLGAALR